MAGSCSHTRPPNEPSFEERLKRLEAAAPGVGEVMFGVQVHFAKLYYAADAGNWKLAEFEIEEVRENMERSATLRPEENGVKLAGVIDAFEQTQVAAMKHAIEKRELKLFQQAYIEAIAVCNSCHQSTGRPFIVITEPASPPVPNQQWTPPVEH
jgi:hypothetical protein